MFTNIFIMCVLTDQRVKNFVKPAMTQLVLNRTAKHWNLKKVELFLSY